MGYADRYSLDAVRWFLATQGPLSGTDADFAHAKFIETYNAELADGLGNCTSRVSNMIDKYFGGVVPENAHDGGFRAPQPGGGSPMDLALAARAAAKNPAPAGARGTHSTSPRPSHSTSSARSRPGGVRHEHVAHARHPRSCTHRRLHQPHRAPFTLAKTMNANPNAKPGTGRDPVHVRGPWGRVAARVARDADQDGPPVTAQLELCRTAAGVALVELAQGARDHSLKAETEDREGRAALHAHPSPAEAPPHEKA